MAEVFFKELEQISRLCYNITGIAKICREEI